MSSTFLKSQCHHRETLSCLWLSFWNVSICTRQSWNTCNQSIWSHQLWRESCFLPSKTSHQPLPSKRWSRSWPIGRMAWQSYLNRSHYNRWPRGGALMPSRQAGFPTQKYNIQILKCMPRTTHLEFDWDWCWILKISISSTHQAWLRPQTPSVQESLSCRLVVDHSCLAILTLRTTAF